LFIAMAASVSMEMQYALILLLPLEWAAIRLTGKYLFRMDDAKEQANSSVKFKSIALTSRIKRNQNAKAA